MRPMSLGMSPGQFTPPSIQYLPSSPSQYGLSPQTSPVGARYASLDGYGATPLNRAKGAGGQAHPLNKRRARGSGSYELPQSGLQWQRLQSSEAGGSPLSGGAGPVRRHNRTASLPNSAAYDDYGASGLRAQAAPAAAPQWGLSGTGSGMSGVETASEGEENMSPPPDPGDWDPFYAEQLLLEEETAPVGNPPTSSMGSGGARLGPGPGGPGQNLGGGFGYSGGGARADALFRNPHQNLGSSAPLGASANDAWYQGGGQQSTGYGSSAPYYGARQPGFTQGFDTQQGKGFGSGFGGANPQFSPQQRRRGTTYQDALSPTQRPRLDYGSKESQASWHNGNPPQTLRGGEHWLGPEGGGADAAALQLQQQQVLQQAFLAQQLSPQRKPAGGGWQQGNGYPPADLSAFSLGPSNLSAGGGAFGSSTVYSQGAPCNPTSTGSSLGGRPGTGGQSRGSFGLGVAQLDSPGKPPPSPQRADSGLRLAYESPGRASLETSKRSVFEGGGSRGGGVYGSPSGHGGLDARMNSLDSPGRRRMSTESVGRGVYGSPGRPPDEGGGLGLGLRSAIAEQQSLGLGGGNGREGLTFGGPSGFGLGVSTPEPSGAENGVAAQWTAPGYGMGGLSEAAFQQAMAAGKASRLCALEVWYGGRRAAAAAPYLVC